MFRSRVPVMAMRAWSRLATEQSVFGESVTNRLQLADSSMSQNSGPSSTANWAKLGFGFAAAIATASTALCDAGVSAKAINLGDTLISVKGDVSIRDASGKDLAAPAPEAASDTTTAVIEAAPLKTTVIGGSQITITGDASFKQKVIFVLGGPGSGKGTQCEKLVEHFDVAHFSAGDLLREHIKSGSPEGKMVADMIKNGQIVPAEVTIGLLQKAMSQSGKVKILIDGFPRNDDNRETFERVVGYDCDLVLYFDCPESVLEQRLLKRGESSGRSDDNIESIKKRFKTFLDSSLPVIQHYEALGKVHRVDTNRPIDQIFDEVKAVVGSL